MKKKDFGTHDDDARPGNLTISQDPDIILHDREQLPQSKSLWSGDDARFLITVPFFLGSSIFCPEAQWPKLASLLQSISSRANTKWRSSSAAPILADRLNVSLDGLARIMAESEVNQIEHTIHGTQTLLRKDWRPRLHISGQEHLDEAMAQGKGAVLWVGHFTFASLFTKMALCEAGYELSHISRPEHGFSKSSFGIKYLNGFRCAAENRFLRRRIVHLRDQPGTTRDAALEVLGHNGILSITVGAWEGRHLATGDLLGSRYTVSTGAAAFAFSSGAKLIPVFTTRDSNSCDYRIRIGSPLGTHSASSLEDFLRAATLELLARHEKAILDSPEQWRGWSKLMP